MRRRLDTELVRRGLVRSRTQAAEVVQSGRVLVAGAPALSASRQVRPDEPITVAGPRARFVSRGGEKLDAAIRAFGVDVTGRRCLDAGASTGGFTDCLLQHGAAHVVAVDVGHGQLAWDVRNDARVTVLDRTNVRDLASIGEPAQVCVADLSFISLRLVANALARLTTDDATFLLLVKPQFEAGRDRVGKGGIVRDRAVHLDVLRDVVTGLAPAGLVVHGVIASPLRGADGNLEFVLHATKDGDTLDDRELEAVVAGAHDGSGS